MLSAKTKIPRTVGFAPEGHKLGDLGPFSELFTEKKDISYGLDGIDCLILWGGTDIHPGYYREPHHTNSGAPRKGPSARDEFEWKAMLYCKAHDIPMIGVCRGAQFLCAFAGGSLVQDTSRHGYDHMIETSDGRKIYSTSSHHQMMNPYNVPHELLAWCSPAQSQLYEDGNDNDIPEMWKKEEPEIVYFPNIRALAIQGHPEYSWATREFQKLCVELANEKLFKE